MTTLDGVENRLLRIQEGHTLPMPAQYANKYEWAAAWVEEHGVTLPPDVPQWRGLRNTICYWNDQYRKGVLNEKVQTALALRGIDFSQYRAPHTGKVRLPPDDMFIEMMRDLLDERGSYELRLGDPVELLDWQKRITERFYAAGLTSGCARIVKALPGLCLGRWARPGDARAVDEAWWVMARRFAAQNALTPAFRGVIHPGTPLELRLWARDQQAASEKQGRLTRGQRGELLSLDILFNEAARRVSKDREQARIDVAIPSRLPPADKRLWTFLGAACLVRMEASQQPLLSLCTHFAAAPADIEWLQTEALPIRAQLLALGASALKAHLPLARQLDTNSPGYFMKANVARLERQPNIWPLQLTQKTLFVGRLTEELRQVAERLAIPQDLPG